MSIFLGVCPCKIFRCIHDPNGSMKKKTAKVSFPKKGTPLDSKQQFLGIKSSWFQGEKFQKEGFRNRKDSHGNPNHSTEFHPHFVGRFLFGTRSWLFEERFRKSLGCFNLQLHWMEQPKPRVGVDLLSHSYRQNTFSTWTNAKAQGFCPVLLVSGVDWGYMDIPDIPSREGRR